MSLCLLLWTLILTFLPCELGERMSSVMFEINESIDQLDWFLFPHGIQKMLPIILLAVQQPVEIKCFGSIACSRDSFKNVRLALNELRTGKWMHDYWIWTLISYRWSNRRSHTSWCYAGSRNKRFHPSHEWMTVHLNAVLKKSIILEVNN